ncbi:MAG: hypothetical protein PVJ72_18535 [Gammaproteobacteria bacterium]|jgi:hypothetical protein
MPKTRFEPQLDGIAFPYAMSFSQQEFAAIQRIHQLAITPALEHLRSDFGPLLNLYDPAPELKNWARAANHDITPFAGGLVFTLLDYYYAHSLPPKDARNPQFLIQPTKAAQSIRQHCWERTLSYLSYAAPHLLVWSAVRNLLPVDLFPERLFTDQIKRAAGQLGDYHDLNIQYAYSIPKAGGHRWLHQQTLAQWETIKRCLDQGKPCPVVLVNRSTRVAAHLCVLVYDYKEQSDQLKTLRVFHTLEPDTQHRITIDFEQEKVGMLATLTHPGTEALQGLLHVPYIHVRPPLGTNEQIMRFTQLPRLYWHLRHWIK